MTRIAFWDCFSGISGDMALGALVDAGLDLGRLRAELDLLGVDGWDISATKETRYGIAGTRLCIGTTPQSDHRHLSDIREILERSRLAEDVRAGALAVFTRLAVAEGTVHGVSPDDVHFHEVGALDAIVDIVGVVICLKLLGVERVYASPLPLGTGWVNAAHGRIPVPGPAVLELLGAVGAPLRSDETPFELVTPTGAALLAEFAEFARPDFKLGRTGYGFGSRDTGRLNAVRVCLGETTTVDNSMAAPASTTGMAEAGKREQVLLLQTNLDDQPGEQLAFVAEQLLGAGALDVWWQSIGMKKGRAALLFSVLAAPEHEPEFVRLLLRETSSLGVRRELIERWVCDRETRVVSTMWGEIRMKAKRWEGVALGAAPEYEDCARIARSLGVPLQEVYAAAQRAAHEQL
jgi:uncharacterized protein (TIGR00299 family) protein